MFRHRAPVLILPNPLAGWVAAAQQARAGAAAARRALASLDYTSLNDDDDDWRIEAFCRAAVSPAGPVAAVCVDPRFVRLARRLLERTGVRVATVVNFPRGDGTPRTVRDEIRNALADGADEIDAVFPYRAFLAGDRVAGPALVVAAKAECGAGVPLKVILETGEFPTAELLAEAARLAVSEGADFLKTSTGKSRFGATPEAAAILLEAILAIRYGSLRGSRSVGLKVSGGVQTTAQAAQYLALAEAAMGPGWTTPDTFRIGASRLMDDLLAVLGATPDRRGAPSPTR